MFQARKTWFKDNCQRRLDLLQSNQNFIDAASSMQEFKSAARTRKKPGAPSSRTTGLT